MLLTNRCSPRGFPSPCLAPPPATHVHTVNNTMEEVSTAGLSSSDFEAVLKSKVAHGLKLERQTFSSNQDRSLPVDVVEAHKTVRYLDDGF